MTYDEAITWIGRKVIYRPPHLKNAPESECERGMVKWIVSERIAMVHFGRRGLNATYLQDLSLDEIKPYV